MASIGAVATTGSTNLQANNLGLQDFLNVLLTQLTYQDPLKPMDNQEFMAQLAQFTALGQTQQLNTNVSALLNTQASLQSVGLIGRTIDITTESGNATGTVQSLSLSGDTPTMTVADDGWPVAHGRHDEPARQRPLTRDAATTITEGPPCSNSIFIGMSGLKSYSEGLRVISNNAANLNTPGFKSSSLQFGDMVYTTSGSDGSLEGQAGFGVQTMGTSLNFKQGDMQQTGNALDLGVDGEGLFTVRDEQGNLHYTRDGQFAFNTDGVLVDNTDQDKVVGIDANGVQSLFTLNGFRSNPAKATTTVEFNGNISSTQTTASVGTVTVLDATGGSHTLSLALTNNQATKPGEWAVVVNDGTTQVGSGTLEFPDGNIDPASSKITFSYKPANVAAQSITLDFSSDVTSFASGTSSTLAQTTQDGVAAGTLTGTTFDATGTMVYTYSNAQTVKGNQLQLARFDTTEAVKPVGSNEFDQVDPALWHTGVAGDQGFGSIKSGVVEVSNVDLSQEFSDLVIMQRGYQASSQIVSTANEMLQQLFTMSGGR